MPPVEIQELGEVTDEVVTAFARLIPQLSTSAPAPDRAVLSDVVSAAGTTVFIARIGGEIVGTLTLVVFRIPTGQRAWIEDVVVDDQARGQGAGEGLTRAALDKATSLGARTVELTSRPSREGANQLYRRIGFAPRETNVYRMQLE